MKPINKITKEDITDFRNWVSREGSDLNEYQRIATKSAIYPGQSTPLGLIYVALKLNGEAGELAEHIGKAMRDDVLIPIPVRTNCALVDRELTLERKALIIKEVGDCLWYLSSACNELGITLSEAALINLEKLLDRTERDTLRGSGDER